MPVPIDTSEHEALPHAERFAAAWDEFFAAVRRARGRAARETQPGTLSLAQFQLPAGFEQLDELAVGELAEAGGVGATERRQAEAILRRLAAAMEDL